MSFPLTYTRVNHRTVRLIASANHKPPVLESLVGSFGARRKLEALESVTSGRLTSTAASTPGYVNGSTYINAAFAYRRPRGNRFNPPAWGAWYSAFQIATALREVAYHLTRALVDAGSIFDNTTHYIELMATFDADFLDLHPITPTPSCLDPREDPGYADGQCLADQVRSAGGNGILYPSVRHAGGECLVAFWPHLVTDFAQGATWRLTWAGSPTPTIVKV